MTRNEWLDLYSRRQSVCNTCKYRVLGICTLCGCVTMMKATITNAKCPKDLWPLPKETVE